jgi:hypothetical protein
MTKLEKLKAAALVACDNYLYARARADAGYTADTRAEWLAYDSAFYAYQVELKKTQKEETND